MGAAPADAEDLPHPRRQGALDDVVLGARLPRAGAGTGCSKATSGAISSPCSVACRSGEASCPRTRPELAVAAGHLAARQAEELAEADVVLPELSRSSSLSGRTIVSYIARPESAITASVQSISSGSKAE